MDRLAGEVTFGLNRLFLMGLSWDPTWWVLADVKHDDGWPWKELLKRKSQFLVREDVKDYVEPHKSRENITYFARCAEHGPQQPEAWHLPTPCHWGGGISIALQAAVLCGHNPVFLVGADLYKFRGPEDADINHFDPNYAAFRANHTQEDWDRTNWRLIHAHEAARQSAAAMGVEILNATVGGHLEVYDRVDVNEVLA